MSHDHVDGDHSPLHDAILKCDVNKVKSLLDSGADIDALNVVCMYDVCMHVCGCVYVRCICMCLCLCVDACMHLCMTDYV